MTKTELRLMYRQKRGDLSSTNIADLSRRIADRFFAKWDLSQTRVLSTFIRISRLNEIDTSIIYYRLWRDHSTVRTVAPSIDVDLGSIESVEFGEETELVENKLGIREPLGLCIDPSEIDLVLVPLLCFDAAGHRVGYGKGYYDRLLKAVRPDCEKVGLSYFSAIDVPISAGEHDVRLNACVTPNEVVRF